MISCVVGWSGMVHSRHGALPGRGHAAHPAGAADPILHPELVGEWNGYMHARLARQPGYDESPPVLRHERACTRWIEGDYSSARR